MKDIAIFGAGGFAKEVATTLERINRVTPIWNLVGFFEDGGRIGREVSKYGKILGGMNELNQWEDELAVVIAIGSPGAIRSVRSRIQNH